jgi:hypothetical protein
MIGLHASKRPIADDLKLLGKISGDAMFLVTQDNTADRHDGNEKQS